MRSLTFSLIRDGPVDRTQQPLSLAPNRRLMSWDLSAQEEPRALPARGASRSQFYPIVGALNHEEGCTFAAQI